MPQNKIYLKFLNEYELLTLKFIEDKKGDEVTAKEVWEYINLNSSSDNALPRSIILNVMRRLTESEILKCETRQNAGRYHCFYSFNTD